MKYIAKREHGVTPCDRLQCLAYHAYSWPVRVLWVTMFVMAHGLS